MRKLDLLQISSQSFVIGNPPGVPAPEGPDPSSAAPVRPPPSRTRDAPRPFHKPNVRPNRALRPRRRS